MNIRKISVYVKRGRETREDPSSLVKANVYIDGEYMGLAGAGGCTGGSGLIGIKLSEGKHAIKVVSDCYEFKREVLIDEFQKVLIFNLTTQEVEKY